MKLKRVTNALAHGAEDDSDLDHGAIEYLDNIWSIGG